MRSLILPEAKKYVIRHKLSITWEQLVLPGTCLGYGFFEDNPARPVSPCLINGNAGA
jgi:hypothetical protein